MERSMPSTTTPVPCLLLHRQSYEGLADWAGGKPWKRATQVALLLLLWGTLCSGLALISDCTVVMADMVRTRSGAALGYVRLLMRAREGEAGRHTCSGAAPAATPVAHACVL